MKKEGIDVIIFGATGMVGQGVLIECLEDTRINKVLVITRTALENKHEKIIEVIHKNFEDYTKIKDQFEGFDACFFCLGISSIGMTEDKYSKITYDFTAKAAESIKEVSPNLTFCYISGTGTDETEKGRIMWARVKGKTENKILSLFNSAYMFRAGYIQPMKGVKSKVAWYQALYNVIGFLYPLFKFLMPKMVTTSVNVGLAMINCVIKGYSKKVLENHDINILAKS